ncbi:MAG: transketolase, partial [Candidatus Andersenbacteria bacterium]|nr:transketolase [Candidatus Andersenbacteria bacterium]
LFNFCYVIDRNNIQIDGHTEEVMPLEPLRDKLEAFGFYVKDVDGHNIREVIASLEEARAIYEKPMAIILHTIPGKGVDFIEYKPEWHGKPPNKEEAEDALSQIRSLEGRISCVDCE